MMTEEHWPNNHCPLCGNGDFYPDPVAVQRWNAMVRILDILEKHNQAIWCLRDVVSGEVDPGLTADILTKTADLRIEEALGLIREARQKTTHDPTSRGFGRDHQESGMTDKIERLRERHRRRRERGERKARKGRCEVMVFGRKGPGVHRCPYYAAHDLDGHRVCNVHAGPARHKAVFTVEDAMRLRREFTDRWRLDIIPRD